MITFTEILGCNGAALYSISDNKMTFASSGRLSVLIAYVKWKGLKNKNEIWKIKRRF